MTSEEKKEIVRTTLKCILAVGYIFLGIHYLCEVLFHKEEDIEIEIDEEDNPVIINIMQFRKQHEEEKNDA